MSAEDKMGAAANRDWLSIREAAEHLGVSQPTIFRWMKQGTLSFYKVGGSTRFSRESLDLFIEKTTGSREAEATAGRCAACGHEMLVDGRIRSTGKIYFQPEKSRFWTLSDSMVGMHAKACTACGFIQLYADTDKLRRLTLNEEER